MAAVETPLSSVDINTKQCIIVKYYCINEFIWHTIMHTVCNTVFKQIIKYLAICLLGIPVSTATDKLVGVIMELAVLLGSDSVAVTLTVRVTLLLGVVVSVIEVAVYMKSFP